MIAEAANIRGIPVPYADTAGLRKAEDPVENWGWSWLGAQQKKQLVLLVFDCNQPVAPEEKELLKELSPRRALLVANKATSKLPTLPRISEITDPPCLFVSAKTGAGLRS